MECKGLKIITNNKIMTGNYNKIVERVFILCIRWFLNTRRDYLNKIYPKFRHLLYLISDITTRENCHFATNFSGIVLFNKNGVPIFESIKFNWISKLKFIPFYSFNFANDEWNNIIQ